MLNKCNLSTLFFILFYTLCFSQNALKQKEFIAIFNEDSLLQNIRTLSSDAYEGRRTGTKGADKAKEYIINQFHIYNVLPLNTTYEQRFSVFTKRKNYNGTNILGLIKGTDNPERYIVISAHYDHLGFGDEGSLYRGNEIKIHNGADDNASGVSLVLDLAAKLIDENKNNNYLFIAFSGEEMGLLGSNFFVKNPTIDISSINYMINMDMVGRLNDENSLAIYGLGTSPIFKQTIKSNNNVFKIIENESGIGPSDHTSFYLQDIPVLHFFTGQHENYHKPSDDSDLINYNGLDLISNYIFSIISDLDDNGKLPFRKTKNESQESPRFKVSLGVIPDYLYDGKGMRIDGVSSGRPAEIAGFIKGDVITKLGEAKIDDMMSYMKALSKLKSGDLVKVEYKRDNKISSKNVTF